MSDVSGGSGGGKWVGVRCGGGGAIGGLSSVERGGNVASTGNGGEGNRKGDKSCSNDDSERVGHVGDARA